MTGDPRDCMPWTFSDIYGWKPQGVIVALPDDLSPTEEIQLQRLLGDVAKDPHAEDVLRSGQVVSDGLDAHPTEPMNEPARTLFEEAFKDGLLDPKTGLGHWNNHDFALTPDQLKRIHAIFTECIAEKLTAEIERLRGAVL